MVSKNVRQIESKKDELTYFKNLEHGKLFFVVSLIVENSDGKSYQNKQSAFALKVTQNNFNILAKISLESEGLT